MKARVPYRFHSRTVLESAASGPRWWRRSYLPGPTWPHWGGLRSQGQGEGGIESATRPPTAECRPSASRQVPGPREFTIKSGKKNVLVCHFVSQLSTRADCKPGLSDNLSSVAPTKFTFGGRQKARPRGQARTSKS